MIIAEGVTLAATPTVSAGTGAANLLTRSPKEVLVVPAGVSTIDVDLGTAQDIDTFFLGFTTADVAAYWWIQKGTSLGGGLTEIVAPRPMRTTGATGPRFHAFVTVSPAVNSRYFRIIVGQTGAAPLQIGALVIAKGFVFPYEFGGGRQPIDLSTVDELPDGGFGIGEGAIKDRLEWTFVDLTPADRRAIYGIAKRVGRHKPIVVDEQLGEGDVGRDEEIHYGIFDRFEPYQRQAPSQTRWALSMTEWA